ncbi:putative spermidine/putrescine transport system permease protein [Aneurinibacillus soli]|uniref:Inner membrane ABC transporter permease protein YdcV n=1 Tax=Aneurinibacillus soli TaxID=1500254 RepID=A0A0U5B387_9BACL|nr:ABC transporter permease [Aneurinibacillus soli]PYE62852.1 putative spermidine/putrescine transport system permease protein [Aneurinibacillus soli]BAU29090.1 Inner membrane ABC transporter permease protein YdcV [Aneurinibacillus soli]
MWLRLYVGVIMVLITLPILVLIPLSFSSQITFTFPPPSYSTKWYTAFFENSQWMDGLWRSLTVAVLTAIVSTIIGTMASMAVQRLEFPGKKIFTNLIVAPMVIPVVVVGIAMYHTFSVYKLTNTITGLVLAHSILAIPMVFVTISASLKGIDRNLELAALSLGSTPIGVFFKVTLPLIKSAMMASALFAFITSLDEVVVSIFIAGASTKTLPIVMWENMRTQVDPTIAAASTLLIVGTILLFSLQGLSRTGQKTDPK